MADEIVRDDPKRTRYEIVVDDVVAGFIDYRVAGDVITMVHTEVDSEWEGHGIGSTLVQGALDDVRSRGLRVQPLCPFVSRFIGENPAYRDLVAS